jgi:hypothetical protein
MELENRDWVDGEEANETAAAAAAAAAMAADSPAVSQTTALAMMTPSDVPSPLLPQPEAAVQPMEQGGENVPVPRETQMEERSFSDRLDSVDVAKVETDRERLEGDDLPTKMVEEAPSERVSEDSPEATQMPQVMPAEPISPVEPSRATPGFRPETRATSMRGSISNRGRPSLDAAESPLGRYKADVSRAIEKLWHRFRQDRAEFVVYGSIKLEFKVDRYGKPRNLKIIKNDANAIMVDFTLSAILKADIPPMPEEILDILDNETLDVTYDVIIY